MNSSPEAASGWTLLRSGSLAEALELGTIASAATTSQGPVRYAVGASGEAGILLPVSPHERIPSLPRVPSLRIGPVLYSVEGAPRRFIEVFCLRPDLEPVFAEVADQVVARVIAGEATPAAVLSTIDDFRTLLDRGDPSSVAITAIAGLAGELLLLNRLLEPSPLAWKAWRGPAGGRHDFAAADHAIEVKTSLSLNRSAVTINSLHQLEPPVGGRLHLCHFTLERAAGGLISIAALAESVLSKSSARDEVLALLAAAGCDDPDSPGWNSSTFRLEDEAWYLIGHGFPRIQPDHAPLGVDNVRYELDLANAVQFRCNEAETDRALSDVIACLHA